MYLTESSLIDWAMRIKARQRVSYAVIARVVSPMLGREPDDPVSPAFISQALNRKHPTNGTKVAKAVISHYDGVTFDKQIYVKVA